MTTWLNDKYEGEYKEGWYHGYGKLKMDNGVIYEGQFVKGHFHGEGKLIYPNVFITLFRVASIRHSGNKEKWSMENTSSMIISSSKKIIGSIASMMTADSIKSIFTGLNPLEQHSKPEKISHIQFQQALMTLETAIINQ